MDMYSVVLTEINVSPLRRGLFAVCVPRNLLQLPKERGRVGVVLHSEVAVVNLNTGLT